MKPKDLKWWDRVYIEKSYRACVNHNEVHIVDNNNPKEKIFKAHKHDHLAEAWHIYDYSECWEVKFLRHSIRYILYKRWYVVFVVLSVLYLFSKSW